MSEESSFTLYTTHVYGQFLTLSKFGQFLTLRKFFKKFLMSEGNSLGSCLWAVPGT